jgi:hypothetical protein
LGDDRNDFRSLTQACRLLPAFCYFKELLLGGLIATDWQLSRKQAGLKFFTGLSPKGGGESRNSPRIYGECILVCSIFPWQAAARVFRAKKYFFALEAGAKNIFR